MRAQRGCVRTEVSRSVRHGAPAPQVCGTSTGTATTRRSGAPIDQRSATRAPRAARRCLSLALVMLLQHAAARADDVAPAKLDPVTVTATPVAATPELTRLLPEAASPQSVLTHQAIEQIAAPLSDFGTLANLTPSFVSSAPNGNSFDAAKNMTLRGFADGQFNLGWCYENGYGVEKNPDEAVRYYKLSLDQG